MYFRTFFIPHHKMTFYTQNILPLSRKLIFISRMVGLLLVLCVNAFVFLTNYHTGSSSSLKVIAEFVDHANVDHQANKTHFNLSLSFKPLSVHVMDSVPALPISLPQFTPAILWLMVFALMISSICFCLFRGEENKNTQFIPGIIIPPPKFF